MASFAGFCGVLLDGFTGGRATPPAVAPVCSGASAHGTALQLGTSTCPASAPPVGGAVGPVCIAVGGRFNSEGPVHGANAGPAGPVVGFSSVASCAPRLVYGSVDGEESSGKTSGPSPAANWASVLSYLGVGSDGSLGKALGPEANSASGLLYTGVGSDGCLSNELLHWAWGFTHTGVGGSGGLGCTPRPNPVCDQSPSELSPTSEADDDGISGQVPGPDLHWPSGLRYPGVGGNARSDKASLNWVAGLVHPGGVGD